jgi:hypothetical protein
VVSLLITHLGLTQKRKRQGFPDPVRDSRVGGGGEVGKKKKKKKFDI